MRTVLLAAVLLSGCAASSAQRPATPAPPPAVTPPAATQQPAGDSGDREDDAVRLAVFRYLLGHNGTARRTFACLAVYRRDHRTDPSPFIMAAISGRTPTVVPGSACESSVDGVFLEADRAKGPGVMFRTEEVKIDGTTATVTGGHYEDGLSASGHLYTVEQQRDGSWQVIGDQRLWIS